MGVLLELLTSERFRKRPAMYAGSARFAEMEWWLRGFEHALRKALPDTPRELDGFREWLQMRLEGPGNYDWEGLIAQEFGQEVEATEKMFECLDLFLEDVARLGLPTIIEKHAEYEIRRYGRLSSSRLGQPRWN